MTRRTDVIPRCRIIIAVILAAAWLIGLCIYGFCLKG